MPRVVFTSQLQRHVPAPNCDVAGATVGAALDAVFAEHRTLRGYVLDEQGHLRKHVAVFVDGARVRDRERLTDPVGPESEIHVLQALTGG
ncbi:MAG: MoaD/ThiS family protein [Betaproteobacteria bacterium]|jgi:sulfur carrier protein ThiS|nr:MoaD/ThiS family protein [Betaproteobacteria bacterium]